MLYRGKDPLTPDEAVEFEIGRVLDEMCDDGLVLRIEDVTGEHPQFAKTALGGVELRGWLPLPPRRSLETPFGS